MYRLLEGVRVVEGASFIAAPYCALTLAQLGAEVIRFDSIGGGPDFHRWPRVPGGGSFYWEGLNRSKKSVAINLSDPKGREIAVALVTAPGPGSGIFVTNYPATGFLSHERLARLRPDLITARIMGHADGANAVDYTVNCAMGVPLMTGPADRPDEPVNHSLPAWDLLAGSTAATSVLAALNRRRLTGQGEEIRVPLSDVAAATLGTLGQVAEVLASGKDRPKIGNELYGAFGRDFRTADGHRLMIVAITGRQWTGLVEALSIQAETAELEASLGISFADDEGLRYEHRDRLNAIVERAVAASSADDLAARFDRTGACWGPYKTLSEAVATEKPFSEAGGLFAPIEHVSGHRYPTPGFPATFTSLARGAPTRASRLGEHTEEILATVLSLSHREIAALHDSGIVQSSGASQ